MGDLEKFRKKIIIIIIILFIMIVSIIGYLFLHKDTENLENNINQGTTGKKVNELTEQKFKEVDSYNLYYSVKGILNNYITMMKQANGDQYIDFGKIKQNREEVLPVLEEEAINSLYAMFDNTYIQENDITKEKVKKLTEQYRKQGNYTKNMTYDLKIDEMYIADILADIKFIIIDFTIDGIENHMLIKMDFQNKTYSIFGEEYLKNKGYSKDTEISNINIDTESIEKNSYNQFKWINTDDKYIINQYFSEYQAKLLNNVSSAYELLDENYRNGKYENMQEFEQYVENNKDVIENTYLSKYQINQFDEYKEYVCIDQNNRYYIFIEKSITDYSVILDTYTIDLKDFTDKYSIADIPTKVGMNVEKVIQAINDRDVKYVYNKLDETFRNNTFGSLDELRTYIDENFYEKNEVEYLKFSEEGDTYIYNVKIKDAQAENSEGKEVTIIMKLLEETNFVMSFSME